MVVFFSFSTGGCKDYKSNSIRSTSKQINLAVRRGFFYKISILIYVFDKTVIFC